MASDADPHYTEVIKQYEICTGCGVTALFAGIGRPMLHPVLDVLLCQECYSRFRNEKFELDDKDLETVCRWCAKGEQACMFGHCSSCPYVFCLSCIARNMNTEEITSAMKAITERDKNDWQCFRCRREALKPLVEKQREFMRRHSALKLNPTGVAASRLLAGRTPGTPDLSNGSVDDSSCDSKNVSFNDKSTDIVGTESSDSNPAPLPESTGFEVDSDSSISRRKSSLDRRRRFMGSNSESEDVSECPTSGPEIDVSKTEDGASPLVWRRASIDVETADEMVVDSPSVWTTGSSSFAVEKIRIENAVHVSPPNSEDYRDASIEIDIGPTGDSQELEADRPSNIFLESQANTPTPSDIPTKSRSPSPRVKAEPLQHSRTHESTTSPSPKVKTEPLQPSATRPSTTSPSPKVKTEPLQLSTTPKLTAFPSPKVKTEPLETSSPRQSNAEKPRSRAVASSPPPDIEPDAYVEIPDSSDDDLRPIDEIFVKSRESESASVKVKVEVTDVTGSTTTTTTTGTDSTEKKRPHSDDSTGVSETPRKPKKRVKKSPRANRSDSSTGTSDGNSILDRIERIKRKKRKKKGTDVDRDSGREEMPMDVTGEDKTEKKTKQKLIAKVSATEDDDLSNLCLDSATRSEYSEFTDEEISATAKIMFKPPSERFCPDNLPSLLRDSESDFSDGSDDSDSSEETEEKKPEKEKKRKKRVKKTASEEEAMSAESGPEESERRTYSRDSCSETDSDSDSDSSSSDDGISVNPDMNRQGVNKNGSNESTPIDMDDDFTPESQADFNKSQEKLPGTPGSQDDELPNLEPKKEKKKKKKTKKKWKIWSDEEGKQDGYSEAMKRKHKTQKKKYESKVDKSWDRFTFR